MFNINYLKGFGGSNVETTSFLHSFIVSEKRGVSTVNHYAIHINLLS